MLARYLPLLWPILQSEADVKHNDVIVTLGLYTTGRVMRTPISHVSLPRGCQKLCRDLCYPGCQLSFAQNYYNSQDIRKLEIKPCGFKSRIRGVCS
jgi:hypothetical protein